MRSAPRHCPPEIVRDLSASLKTTAWKVCGRLIVARMATAPLFRGAGWRHPSFGTHFRVEDGSIWRAAGDGRGFLVSFGRGVEGWRGDFLRFLGLEAKI